MLQYPFLPPIWIRIDWQIGDMRKILISALLIGGWVRAQPQTLASSLLWKVEGESIQTSYVFGTFHLLPQEDYFLKESVVAAFNDSELIVMELDMDDATLQKRMMNRATMTDGTTLDKYINPEEQEKLEEILSDDMGMGFEQVNSMKPFVVASMLIPSFIEGVPASYEASLLQLAFDQDKEVRGLETVEEQIETFDKIPYESQVEDLLAMLNDKTTMMLLFDELIQAYKDEDINEIYRLTKTYMNGKEELQVMVTDRNRSWIDKIGEISSGHKTFYAVGAAHLGGRHGLIHLLKAEGLQVTPVKD